MKNHFKKIGMAGIVCYLSVFPGFQAATAAGTPHLEEAEIVQQATYQLTGTVAH